MVMTLASFDFLVAKIFSSTNLLTEDKFHPDANRTYLLDSKQESIFQVPSFICIDLLPVSHIFIAF